MGRPEPLDPHRVVYEHTSAVVFVTSPDGRVHAANPAACHLLGLTEEEICRRGRSGLVDPAVTDIDRILADRDLAGSARAVITLIAADGRRIPVDCSSVVFTEADGGTRTVIVGQDLSAERQAMLKVQSAHNALTAVIDSTTDLIWAVDPESLRFTWFNRAAAAYTRDELGVEVTPGMNVTELTGDAARGALFDEGYRAALAGDPVTFEYTMSTGTRILQITIRRVDVDQAPVAVVVFGRDVTEQRRALERLRNSERRYRVIVETMREGVVFQDAGGRILFANRAAELIEERESDDLVGRTSNDPAWGAVRADGTPFPGEEHPAMVTLATGEPQQDVIMGLTPPSGRRRWISINSAPVFGDDSGRPTEVVSTFHDITEQRQAEETARIADIAFRKSQEGIVVTDAETRILRVNDSFTRITGYELDEAVGRTPGELLKSGRQDAAFYQRFWQVLNDTGSWQGEIWNRRRDGEIFPEWLTVAEVRDDSGELTHYVATFLDLSTAKRAEEDILTLSLTDHLTGLPNRRLMLDRLAQAVQESARRGRMGTLVLFDVDAFKVLNDTRGHVVGDLLLIEIGQRLVRAAPAGSTVARVGSDEFAILTSLEDTDPGDVARSAEQIAQAARAGVEDEPIVLDGQPYRCRLTGGIALFGAGVTDPDEALRRADAAIAEARRLGTGGLRFFSAEFQRALETRVEVESALSVSLPDGIRILLQPQVDRRGRVIGAEALARWLRADGTLVPPADFIPIAEDSGLIIPIGRAVLEQSCDVLRRWESDPATRHLTVSVNVSEPEIMRESFTSDVRAIVESAGIDPTRLKFEVTESLLIEDVDHVARVMDDLRALGVGFSLDDFGTGYSSLRLLKGLPFDQLKIDRGFVADLVGIDADPTIVRTIITMGQFLGLTVVAEGVETAEQRAVLTMLGCEAFQGYHFAAPLSPDEFVEYVRAHRSGH